MSRRLKRRLLVGAAVAAVLAGGTLAAVTAARQGPLGHGAGAHRSTHRHGHKSNHRRGHSLVALAAGYLGSSTTQLQSELRSGKTLAQIANATSGKSEAGLIQALVAAEKARLAAAAGRVPQRVALQVNRVRGSAKRLAARVRAGKLTQAQESAILARRAAARGKLARPGGRPAPAPGERPAPTG